MAEPSGSNYSASLDDDTSLLADVTNQKTFIISGSHSAVLNTLTTTATVSGVTAPGYLVNGRTGEVVHFTGTSGVTFTGCTRGADGTTGAIMNDADVLYHASVANYHNQLKAAIIAIQTELGVNPSGDYSTVAERLAVPSANTLEMQIFS